MWDDEESGSPSWNYSTDPFMYDYGVFVNPEVRYDVGDIFDPANYPRSDENPAGYDPNASYNQPYSGGIDFSKIWKGIKDIGGKAVDYVGKNPGQVGLMAALAALGALSKAPPSGGGTTKRYVGPAQQLTRTVEQGRYGPIAKYAAQGGIMHAYANGGQVRPAYAGGQPLVMQDGGFVMTGDAVNGAEKTAGGIQNLLPEATMISAPGGPTDDLGATKIVGKNTTTPARVSNGEAYVPPGRNTREMYALMKYLEGMGRRA